MRREAVVLARDAARLFLRQLQLDAQSLAVPADGAPSATSLVLVDGRGRSDEAEAILSDSFQRLTGVVALSLQVDEPRLVSEELQWLDRSLGVQFEAVSGVSGPGRLIDSFSGACRQYLSSEETDILDDWLARACSGLAETEPLLTEPGINPHIEGRASHDE